MPIYEDAVRPFQLPQNAPATAELNLFNVVSQAPITVVAGQNGSIGSLPPIQTSQRTYSLTITSYMDQTAKEQEELMSLVYRTAGPWGPGKGSDLAPTEVDNNFWQNVQAIAAKAAQGVGISHFMVAGDQMTVVLTDATMVGPYTLPTASLVFVGTWQPSHAYLVNQIFTHGGATYVVTFNHTSATSFDPGANDGAGNDYYGLLLSNPSVSLPVGGDTGDVLTKTSTADFATAWNPPTLAGLTDVLPTPTPASGQVVYWNGSAFSYKTESGGGGGSGSLAGASDVLASPAPSDGEAVIWSAADNAFTYGAPAVGGPLNGLSDVNTTGVEWALQTDQVLTWVASDNLWENIPKQPHTNWTGSTLTLDLSYVSGLLDANGFGTQTLTLPTRATAGFFPWATNLWVRQGTTVVGQVSIVGASGVTVFVPTGRQAKTRAIGSLVRIGRTRTDDQFTVSGDLAYVPVVLPASGGATIDPTAADTEVYTLTPTANATFTASSAPCGKRMTVVVTTSGTSSFTLTFGSGFKTIGTLATGTVTAKVFSVSFIGDGTNMVETSRTTAM